MRFGRRDPIDPARSSEKKTTDRGPAEDALVQDWNKAATRDSFSKRTEREKVHRFVGF
jgi:hypothetical protein